jgi:hypothetical protein
MGERVNLRLMRFAGLILAVELERSAHAQVVVLSNCSIYSGWNGERIRASEL